VSQENVEIARAVYDVEGDVAAIPRDDELWATWTKRVAPYFDPGFEIHIATGVATEGDTFSGWDGTRAAALDWYAAFATYRRDIEEAIDLGERVLLLMREYGSLEDSDAEINSSPAHLLTFRDGKIVRWDAFSEWAQALQAVGLEE
jgi:hypothetical protein